MTALTIMVLLVQSVGAYASETTLTTAQTEIPNLTMDMGATFHIDLTTGSVINLDTAMYEIGWNNGHFQLNPVTDLVAGTVNGVTVPISQYFTLGAGSLRILQNIAGYSGASGSGSLSTYALTAIGADTSSSNITFNNFEMGDIDAEEITVTPPSALTVTIDQLRFTGLSAGVPGGTYADPTHGYKAPTNPDACQTTSVFTLSATGVAGGTASGYAYTWTLGADGSGTTNIASPTDIGYNTAGDKTVKLEVKDSLNSTTNDTAGGATNFTDTITTALHIYDNLLAGFSADRTSGMIKPSGVGQAMTSTTQHPTQVTFTDGTTGGDTTYANVFAWDIDDDGSYDDSTDQSPANVNMAQFFGGFFSTGGLHYKNYFTIKLQVDDGLITGDDDKDVEAKTNYINIVAAGDVDGDGLIEAEDITKLEQVIIGSLTASGYEDCNDNGTVNLLDITKAERLAAQYASWATP